MTERSNFGNSCELCGFVGKNLVKHVTKIHNLTTKEYKNQFPNSKLVFVSDAQKMLAKRKTTEWFSKQENKEKYLQYHRSVWQKRYWTEQGLSDIEAVEKVKQLQKRKFSQETLEIFKKQRSGNLNSMSLEKIAKRNNVSLEEAKCLTPCYKRTGNKHPMFGKKHSKDTLIKICKNTPVTFFNKSKGEKELQQFVSTLIFAEFNKAVEFYNCDIVVEKLKLIIEFYGDYWHCNPAKFEENYYNKRLHSLAKEKWNKDFLKKSYFENLGYEYCVVWESDWKQKKEEIKEKIKCKIQPQ